MQLGKDDVIYRIHLAGNGSLEAGDQCRGTTEYGARLYKRPEEDEGKWRSFEDFGRSRMIMYGEG